MSANDKLMFLKDSIEERLKSVDSKRIHYRKSAFRTYISIAIISAITAVLLGLKIQELNEIVRVSGLILTTTITLLSAYNAFFNSKELWISNNTARNRFYKLKFDIEYSEKGGILTEEVVDKFKSVYQEILDDLNMTWQKNRMNENK